MNRRRFLRNAAGLLVPLAMPGIIGRAAATTMSLTGAGNARRQAASGGGAFTPPDAPGLLAWYSADSLVYSDAGTTLITDGTRAQQQNDKSGNNYHLKAAATNHRPLYQATGFNSRPTLFYDNPTNLAGWQTDNGVATGTGSAFSCFFVGQMLAATGTDGGWLYYVPAGASAGDIGSVFFIRRDGSNNGFRSYTQYTGFTAAQAISLSTNYRLGTVCQGLSSPWTPYVNGVAGTPGAMTASTNNNFISGGFLSVSGGFEIACLLSEWCLYIGALSGTNITNLDNYFKAHWGL